MSPDGRKVAIKMLVIVDSEGGFKEATVDSLPMRVVLTGGPCLPVTTRFLTGFVLFSLIHSLPYRPYLLVRTCLIATWWG